MKKSILIIKIIFINILIAYLLLYFIEIYFQNKSKNLFKKNFYYKFKEITDEQKLMPMIRPTHLKDIHLNKIVPVSLVSNSKTLLCVDNEKPIYFKTDAFGFDNEVFKKEIDVVLIGDSFAAGYCVDKEYRFNSQFKQKGLDIVNFGMGGNGPLLEFASLVEYAELFNYKTIVWLFTPENDYENFEREIKNPILKKYLDPNFRQNLVSKNEEKNELYYEYFQKKDRPFRELLRQYHLDLNLLRKKIKNIEFKKENKTKNYLTYYDFQTVNSVNNVFKNLKNYADIKGKNLLIVFNVLNPEFLFNDKADELKKDIERNKSFLKNKGIDFFDFNEYISKKYVKSNIDQIMKKRDDNIWDHYTEEGYRLLTEQISIKIKNN